MPQNRLMHEKSPYLLQHAHNPVDWLPWGSEAFEKARRENKPIFLVDYPFLSREQSEVSCRAKSRRLSRPGTERFLDFARNDKMVTREIE